MQLDEGKIQTFIIYDNIFITEDFTERGHPKWHMKLEDFLLKSKEIPCADILMMYESLIDSILVTSN